MADEQPRRERRPQQGNKRFGDKQDRPDRWQRSKRSDQDGERRSPRGGKDRERTLSPQQERRIQRRGDLRVSNREDRGPSPDIDADVTGKELNKMVLGQISGMDERNRTWVAKHLVMAGRLLEEDPQLAFSHALAASRRGGRHAVVREAVGLTAYAAGEYHDALREFRTYRRISGDQSHLPLMAACEAALGRPEKALELYQSVEAEKLPAEGQADMAIIISGVYADQKEYTKAKEVLELPQLDLKRAFSFSPRLFRAYGEALTDLGEIDEAQRWYNQANVADQALGTGYYAEPEIIDLDLGEDVVEEKVTEND